MLSVSDTAAEILREALDETEGELVFRLTPSPGGFKMQLDSPSEQDRTVESEDRVVLVLAPEVDEALTGAVLDIAGEDPPQLMLRPAGDTC